MIPHIPRMGPPGAAQPEPETPETFTVRDGLAWLGISMTDYEEAHRLTIGRHGNPIGSALLDARKAQHNGETPDVVLARHGIDPGDVLAAVREYVRQRSRFDD